MPILPLNNFTPRTPLPPISAAGRSSFINSASPDFIKEFNLCTEGRDIEECRRMLRDALKQMVLAYKQLNKEIPIGDGLIEQLPVDIQDVYQTA
jgi:predicted RNase H-like HicB family nuclease